MRVVLTGSTGFVGSHVLRELLDHGHDVTAVVRDGTQSDAVTAQGAKAEVVDLYDRQSVSRLMEQGRMGRSTLPVRGTRRAPIWTQLWSMRSSMPSMAPGKPVCADQWTVGVRRQHRHHRRLTL